MDVSKLCPSCWLSLIPRDPQAALQQLLDIIPSLSVQGVVIWMSYVAVLFILTLVIPGKRVLGRADEGTSYPRPSYKINGLSVAMTFFVAWLACVYSGLLSPTLLYDNFGEIFAAANIWAFTLVFLHWFIPTYITHRVSPLTNGIPVVLRWWFGVELHPALFGIDLKTFAYRPGMLGFLISSTSAALMQYSIYGKLGR